MPAITDTIQFIFNVFIAFIAYLCGFLIKSNFKNASYRKNIFNLFFLIFSFSILSALFLITNKNASIQIVILNSTLKTTFFMLMGILIGKKGIF